MDEVGAADRQDAEIRVVVRFHPAVRVVARRVLPFICVCICAVAIIAVIDHEEKQRRIDRAEVAEWYCLHGGTRCGGVRSANIERRWNEREAVYAGAICALTVAGAASALGFGPRRA